MGHLRRSAIASIPDRGEIRYPVRLRWVCVRCANSCRDISRHRRNILLAPRDTERISKVTKLGAQEFSVPSHARAPYERQMKKIGGSCMFLEGSNCSIYRARPLICRFYPFSLHPSRDEGFEISYDRACTGIGKGPIRSSRFFQALVRLAQRELTPHWDRLTNES
jgi:hypothetical protein